MGHREHPRYQCPVEHVYALGGAVPRSKEQGTQTHLQQEQKSESSARPFEPRPGAVEGDEGKGCKRKDAGNSEEEHSASCMYRLHVVVTNQPRAPATDKSTSSQLLSCGGGRLEIAAFLYNPSRGRSVKQEQIHDPRRPVTGEVRAYILIQTAVNVAQVARDIRELDGIESADDVSGPYDVIVRASADSMDSLGRMVVARIQTIEGVTRTLTCPVVSL